LDTIEYIRTLPHKYQNLLLKYFFYKVSDKLAYRHKANAVITGEALGQVSTQTIQNITLLDKYIYHSVFRPTLFMSKLEIIDIAEKIGTFDMSYKGKEFCAIATKNVVTGGRKDIFDGIIKDIPLQDILQSLVKGIKVMGIDDFDKMIDENKEDFDFDISGLVIINLGSQTIGHKDERIMDLDKALEEYEKWDKTKTYKIICDEGVKSKILIKKMQERGFILV
jgi:thiamine biosynthesis protein ThiI